MESNPKKPKKLMNFLYDRNISQRALAQRAGMGENYISLMINGRYVPSQVERKKIAKALRCNIQEIFEE